MLKNTINHFLKKKNRKSVKQSEIITYQPKSFVNPNSVDIKSVITEHPKNSHIRKGEKVGSNSSLYSETSKGGNFLNEKKHRNNKTRTCF